MSSTAGIVLDTFIGIGILLLLTKAFLKKNERHIPSRELRSSDITKAFRRVQRP